MFCTYLAEQVLITDVRSIILV